MELWVRTAISTSILLLLALFCFSPLFWGKGKK